MFVVDITDDASSRGSQVCDHKVWVRGGHVVVGLVWGRLRRRPR